MGLWCKVPRGRDRAEYQVLVFDYAAVDQDQFWASWRAVGGMGQGLVTETGRAVCGPVVPPPVPEPQIIKHPASKAVSRWGRVWLALCGLGRALRDALFPWEKRDDESDPGPGDHNGGRR